MFQLILMNVPSLLPELEEEVVIKCKLKYANIEQKKELTNNIILEHLTITHGKLCDSINDTCNNNIPS